MGRGFVYGPQPLSEGSPRRRNREAGRRYRSGHLEPPPPSVSAAPSPPVSESPDNYKEKLLKYVPAEVLAFFVPITAFVGGDEKGWLIVIFVVGLVGTLIYLIKANLEVPPEQRAPRWNYVLAILAFAAWALATSPATATVFSLNQKSAGIILAVAAFLIPAVDSLLSQAQARDELPRQPR